MARDATRLAERNQELFADYNKLKVEEHAFRVKGRVCYTRLKREQIISILSKLYHLSPRRVEVLIYATEPKPVAIKTAA